MHSADNAIIQRILAGNVHAYAELVNRHKARGMTLAMRMLNNREDAEEALQDAFVRAFRALPKFEMKSSFATWFYRIVFNVCSSALQKRGETFVISLEDEEEGLAFAVPPSDSSPDVHAESAEFNRIVGEEIGRLPAAYRAVVTLFFVQDMSYDEIVEVTGMPLGTVKTHLFRARVLLREAIGKRFKDNVNFAGDVAMKKERV
ncbi:MAG TPA: sigma-70 family RNA polymerase sigma factor [Candidatus Kapabacteria bacterium]|nr:sigma-70 family RNA polymerase sigma factor [Candidatus Kapabacteria bacterium]